MSYKEIELKHQDSLIELISIYGEAYLINLISETLLIKEGIIRDNQ